MFKVNNKDTRTTPLASFWCLYCWFWTYFTPCSSVSTVIFEHVIAGWVDCLIIVYLLIVIFETWVEYPIIFSYFCLVQRILTSKKCNYMINTFFGIIFLFAFRWQPHRQIRSYFRWNSIDLLILINFLHLI